MSTSTDTVLFQSLHRRPEARTITVRELIQKVRNGEVRVPRFQRPLRWRAEDVRKLLDSIWKGYPVGSLQFWKRKADAETLMVGVARTAFHTTSTSELRAFIGLLGLRVRMQEVIRDEGRVFDRMSVVNPRDGAEFDIYFNITVQWEATFGGE